MQNVNETKRTDLYRIDPRNIKMKEGFNIRSIDAESPDMLRLMESIKVNGVKRPLLVKANPDKATDGKEYLCIDGHRRLTAVLMLIEQGEDIAYLKAELVSKMSEEDAVLSMFTLNDGEPLSLIERAEGVRRLMDVYGYNAAEVAEKISESAPTVSNLYKLSSMPKAVKKKILQNIISPTLALEMARACKNENEFIQKIEELTSGVVADEAVVGKRGKRAKITAKNAKHIVGEKNVVKMLDKVNEDIKTRYNGEKANFFQEFIDLLKTKPKAEQVIQLFDKYAESERV